MQLTIINKIINQILFDGNIPKGELIYLERVRASIKHQSNERKLLILTASSR